MTLLLELTLTRVFDVILTPNLAYMVITCALFFLGLAGIYTVWHGLPSDARLQQSLVRTVTALAATLLLLRPVLNALPFDYERLFEQPLRQLVAFAAMYLALGIPFFLSGLVFATIFSRFARDIQRLYCWDLAGAAAGCVVLVPLLPRIGPGGTLLVASGLTLAAAALLDDGRRARRMVSITLAGVLIALAWRVPQRALRFRPHTDKQGGLLAYQRGDIEFERWDPISKIEVYPVREKRIQTETGWVPVDLKFVGYDGGSQSTNFYRFDGDLRRLRAEIDAWKPGVVLSHFWRRSVMAAHYLKRDRGAKVLIFGSAGGQETKAALLFGASHIDAVEMVRTVVELGHRQYAAYIGHIFEHPEVRVHVAEGRSFLRASPERYDIIQIFSNHTTSSIASGTGAMHPTYLQTAEAYQEYFEHLKPDGVLQVNHHIYPRIITTAALAWRRMGRHDFRSHVAVFDLPDRPDMLPLVLIKMTPWTRAELDTLAGFLCRDRIDDPGLRLVENPLAPGGSFLSADFYSGELPRAVEAAVPYYVSASTDDRPFFSLLRKRARPLTVDLARFTDSSDVLYLNSELRRGVVPMDWIHLIVTGAAGLFFALIFVLVPLRWGSVGRDQYPGKTLGMIYFSCLGAGFITLELMLIQLFMRPIGYPLYTYSTVICAMLLAAGVGSGCSRRLGVSPEGRWWLPFWGVAVTGFGLLALHARIFHALLAQPMAIRVAACALLIFPLGFFLGMPFPLGTLVAERQSRGAVAWGWGMNGLFTVIGGLGSILVAIAWGFQATIAVALTIYIAAFVVFAQLRLAVAASERSRRPISIRNIEAAFALRDQARS